MLFAGVGNSEQHFVTIKDLCYAGTFLSIHLAVQWVKNRKSVNCKWKSKKKLLLLDAS